MEEGTEAPMTVNMDKDVEGKEIVDEEEVKVDKTGMICCYCCCYIYCLCNYL